MQSLTTLIPERTDDPTMRLMAQRIDISQRDEIAMMQGWLRDRGLDAPSGDPNGPLMICPGCSRKSRCRP